jgi:hypothetical protein
VATGEAVGIPSRTALSAGAAGEGGLRWRAGPPFERPDPPSSWKDLVMADIGLLALTVVLFGLLALVVKGVERL